MNKIVLANLEDVNAVDQKIDTMVKPLYEEKSQTENGTSISPSNAKLIEQMDELWGKSEKSKNLLNINATNSGSNRGNFTIGNDNVVGVCTTSGNTFIQWRIDTVVGASYTATLGSGSTGSLTLVKTDGVSAYGRCDAGGSVTFTAEETVVHYRCFVGGTVGQTYTWNKPMISKGSTALPYSPYFDGIHSIEQINVKEVWKNQWDEQWESGTILPSDGTKAVDGNYIRSKNKCLIKSGETVFYTGASSIRFFFYGNGENYLSYIDVNAKSSFAVPSGARYFAFRRSGTAYNNDIALVYGTSGEYAPYEEKSSLIPLTSPLRGINDVRDRIYERTYKGMKSVDMGTLNWTHTVSTTGSEYAYCNLSDLKTTDGNVLPNMITNYCEIVTNEAKLNYSNIVLCANGNQLQMRNITETTRAEIQDKLRGYILHYKSTEGGEDYTTFVDEGLIGVLDMGTIDYTYSTQYKTFSTPKITLKANGITNLLCSVYPTSNVDYKTMGDKSIAGRSDGQFVEIKDTSYNGNIVDFKTAMQGVELQYELATPTITELSAEAIEVIRSIRNIDADHHLIVTDQYGNDVTYILTYLVEKATDNVVLIAPNGTKWKLTVSNTGALSAVAEN